MGQLSRNVRWNLIGALAALTGGAISVPLIIGRFGVSAYGLWTLALTAVAYLVILEAGVGPAIQRFIAVAHGADDLDTAARLMWSTLLVYTAIGLVLAAAIFWLAPTLVAIFNVPRPLHPGAVGMFRVTSGVCLLALVATALGNVQQGLERYAAYSASNALGTAALVIGIIVAVVAGAGLPGLAEAAAAQYSVIGLCRAATLADVLLKPITLTSRGEARKLLSFSLRIQVSAASMLLNLQTDKIVVGLIASPRILGQLAIGVQIAEAGRLLGSAALSPIVSRMATVHGDDSGALETLYSRLAGRWTLVVVGLTLLGLATLYPLVSGWLGSGHGEAAKLGGFLIVGYGFNLLSGPGVAYLRAINKPNLEALLGGLTTLANLGLTVSLGLLLGPIGVVAATAGAFAVESWWFSREFHRWVHLSAFDLNLRVVLAAILFALPTFGWGLLVTALAGRWFSLPLIAAGSGLAFVAYLSLAGRTSLKPSSLKALFA